MSSVINTDLYFFDSYGSFISPVGGVFYRSADSFVLIGSAVTLEDQQHENNKRVNYLSYRIKHVKIHGEARIQVPELPVKCGKITVVLYKVPVKYENGIVAPNAVIDGGVLRPKTYVLCSDPQSVLSWKIFSYRYVQYDGRYWLYFDFSLSYDKAFVLGPYDALCFNILFESDKGFSSSIKSNTAAKIYYDLN